MSFTVEKLYGLLPAVYRIRDTGQYPDAETEGPLKALLTIIGEQLAVVEENLDQLYDDQFIETCAEWVVPYIGDLVGTRGIVDFSGAPFSQRSQVAKTIAYRRRKGTAAVLEELAFDVTGWRSNVVEYFQLLATTQHLNHLRPDNLSIAPVRGNALLEFRNTSFDRITHSIDVRRIERRRGKYNIHNVGIFLWRIQSYRLRESPAWKVDERRYKFDPLGMDIALYNQPETENEITHLAEPINIPMPIRRRVFSKSPDTYYGENKSVLIFMDGKKLLPGEIDILPDLPSDNLSDLICICDLSDAGGTGDWSNMPTDKIGIDPLLGRIALPPSLLSPPHSISIKVNYRYGFSADIGGGTYSRLESFSMGLKPIIKVPEDAPSIKDALDMIATTGGVIEIGNSDYHHLMPLIEIGESVKVEIRAALECRPILIIANQFTVLGGNDAELSFNGLLFCGGTIHVPPEKSSAVANRLHVIQLTHCTLAPVHTPFDTEVTIPVNPRLIVEAADARVNISKCIVGGMRVADAVQSSITDSILDAGDNTEVAYSGLPGNVAGGALTIENSTVIGKVKTIKMSLASNTIFNSASGPGEPEGPVMAARIQEGCVRYSYIPPRCRVPKPFHCQPESDADALRVKPIFTSLQYGNPGYCQLSRHCVDEIRLGAENNTEMGVLHHLYQPLREFNLRTRLDEYLRFGLEAGIYYGS